jgi:eukaryotic-like serine/threonine-protein kinase
MSLIDTVRAALGSRYSIERELGRGGMGAVYLARDMKLDRPVALKVLPSEYASQPMLRDRFVRETRLAAGFSHPNIVPVYAVEETDDILAYAMGFIEGESLTERVRRAGPMGARDIVRLLQDVAYALAYAHGRGVVHRDIKPDNVMIERATGRALIMDFGISRVIAGPMTPTEGLTRIGEVVGTPEYMSPEQATGDDVDGRSDLYSLGFAATGRPAVTGDTTGKILARQITEPLAPIHDLRPDLPAPLAEAIDRCAAKNPSHRFQRAEALVEAIDLAQLAGPQVPLAIRMFALEAETLSTVVIFVAFLGFFMWRANAEANFDNLDAVLPLLLLAGVGLTRVSQTLSEARRLANDGFSAADIHRGLVAVIDERAERRLELRNSASARRTRRRTAWWTVALIVGAFAMAVGALRFRREWKPGYYATSLPGVVLVFTAAVALGVGLVLALRSPFRMPLKERLLRLIWLGPVGSAVLDLTARGVRRVANVPGAAAAPALRSVGDVPARRAPLSAAAHEGDRVAALEQRVESLEAWQRGESAAAGD